MRLFPKEAWRLYASLLFVFFALAALAVWHTLGYMQAQMSHQAFINAAIRVWGLTFGFMFITGAFGLWAIQFSTEIESLRIIGNLVDSMDYLQDGLLALDKRGNITGSNPAISTIIGEPVTYHDNLSNIIPCLTEKDVNNFTTSNQPQEIERDYTFNDTTKTLRFRSQPSEGVVLILVSDVTTMAAHHIHRRQATQLQLIGHIAKGVAHDFNNLLCVISGHAALLKRLPPDSKETVNSISAIEANAERGSSLAGQLMELSRQGASRQRTNMSQEYVKSAATLLKGSLSSDWTISTDIKPMPMVSLTGIQIEQVVLHLAMLASDTMPAPGSISLSTGTPSDMPEADDLKHFSSSIVITANQPENQEGASELINTNEIESGVILSVIQSMIEEAGAKLSHKIGKDGSFTFIISLPPGITASDETDSADLGTELEAYIARWNVLLAVPSDSQSELSSRMQDIGMSSINVDSITSTLAHIEEDVELDAILLDDELLNAEVRGLLKAIIKLRPSAAIVVLCNSSDSAIAELSSNIIFELKTSSPNRILKSMIEARNLAIRRKQ